MKAIVRVASLTSLALAGVAAVLFAACDDGGSSSGGGLDAGDAQLGPPTQDDAAPAPVDGAMPDVVTADVVDAADAAVVSADLAADFSSTANPNGAWTFGYTPGSPEGDAGALVPFTMTSTSMDVHLWFDPANVNLNAPSIFRNDSTATVNGVAPGEAGLHPGNVQEYAVARWKAPVAGKYAVKVQFKAGDVGDTNGLLLHNGKVLVKEDSTSTNAVHQLDVTLAANDTLDVAVGNKGDFFNDSTPVVFSIRTAP